MSEMPPDPNQFELPYEDPNQVELFTADGGILNDGESNNEPVRPAPDLLINLSDNDRLINNL